jgi:hypothetical protein
MNLKEYIEQLKELEKKHGGGLEVIVRTDNGGGDYFNHTADRPKIINRFKNGKEQKTVLLHDIY